jgi:type II secretory pathway pseudopilin PulG
MYMQRFAAMMAFALSMALQYDAHMKHGFTLIETIIYMALLSTLITGSLLITYGILDSSIKNQSESILNSEAAFVMKKIEWAMTGATAINNPPAGNSGSVFSITNSGVPYVFDISAGEIRLSRNGAGAEPLTTQNVSVTSFSVSHIGPLGAKPRAANITLTINGRPFNSTFYLRK